MKFDSYWSFQSHEKTYYMQSNIWRVLPGVLDINFWIMWDLAFPIVHHGLQLFANGNQKQLDVQGHVMHFAGVRRLVIIEVGSKRVEFVSLGWWMNKSVSAAIVNLLWISFYRYSTSNRFSSRCLLDRLNTSSEHIALKIANHVEAAFCVWRQRAHQNVPWSKILHKHQMR